MKMFNVIVTLDTYILAESEGSAIDDAIDQLKLGELSPTHRKAMHIVSSPIRPQCQDEPVLVGSDISEPDFKSVKGMTTQQAYEFLTKRPR